MLRNVSDAQRSFFSVMQAKGTQPNPFTGADASGKTIDFYIDDLNHTPPEPDVPRCLQSTVAFKTDRTGKCCGLCLPE